MGFGDFWDAVTPDDPMDALKAVPVAGPYLSMYLDRDAEPKAATAKVTAKADTSKVPPAATAESEAKTWETVEDVIGVDPYLVTQGKNGAIKGRAETSPYAGWTRQNVAEQWQTLMRDPQQAAKWKLDLYMAGYYGTDVNAGQLIGSRWDKADIDALWEAVTDSYGSSTTWQKAAEYKIIQGYEHGGPVSIDDIPTAAEEAEARKQAKDEKKAETLAKRAEAEDLAQFKTSLRDFAFNNGIKAPDTTFEAEAKRYAQGETSLELIKSDWREKHLTSVYPQWAEEVRSGRDLIDIASPFISNRAAMLGLNPNAIDMFDADVRRAMQTGMTLQDWDQQTRNDPRWATSDDAWSMANDFLSQINNTFRL